jgi:3-oxoacyl-[acyl-carrier-protein] synthase II
MMPPIYIQGFASISAQNTIVSEYFFENISTYTSYPVPAIEPEYKTLIPALQLRRMNKSMRMALFTGQLALQQAQVPTIDAIILGSGMGCLTDSEKFVEALLEDEEQRFNPTPFIQSTHNMAAATLALALQCKGYNMTYVNNANSVASALVDSQLYLTEHPYHTVLLGGVEELGKQSPQFWQWAGYAEIDHPHLPPAENTHKEMISEGAALFVASAQKLAQTIAKIHAVEYATSLKDPQQMLLAFMERHGLVAASVDAVLLGISSAHDQEVPLQQVASELFEEAAQVGYKHVLGEHDSIAASALALACQLLQKQSIPEVLLFKSGKRTKIQHILIFHQRRGSQPSIIWLSNDF